MTRREVGVSAPSSDPLGDTGVMIVSALDVDGVVNAFTKSPRKPLERVQIGEWPIQWREPLIARLRAVLARPDVEGAWLTTWLEQPDLLDHLERALGLDGLVPHRAEHPAPQDSTGQVAISPKFDEDTSTSPHSPRWWKFRAAQFLVEELRPERFAWFDDDLGRAKGIPGDPWRPATTPKRLLRRTDSIAGLLPADLDALEAWVGLA